MQTRSPRVPWWRPLALAAVAVPSIFMLTPDRAPHAARGVERTESERERVDQLESRIDGLTVEVTRLRMVVEAHDAKTRAEARATPSM